MKSSARRIKVTVVSSSFAVFVTGAVVRPGKISSDRALTAFDAIMEAGGFDGNRANAKEVRVVRQEDGQTKTYTLNLKTVLDGGQVEALHACTVVQERGETAPEPVPSITKSGRALTAVAFPGGCRHAPS